MKYLIPIASVAIAAFSSVARADEGEALHLAGCPGVAAEYRATLEDRIVLDKLFFDAARDEDEQIRESIRQQVKFVWGYLRNSPKTHATLRAVLSAEDPEIEIRAKTATTYGRAMTLDWSEKAPDLQITDPYTSRAIARGRTEAGDPALTVDYAIHLRIALCAPSEPAGGALDALLPRDPWLAHWHVAKADRRLLRYYDEQAVTNPCADDDYADLPHPFYYWYDWEPERIGLDANGGRFDCAALIHEGTDYFRRPVRLARMARLDGERAGEDAFAGLLPERGPVRATVVVGVLDHGWADLALPRLLEALSKPGDLSSRAASLLLDGEKRERGSTKLLALLRDLPGVMKAKKHVATVENGYLRVDLEGTLARSRRPVRLRAYYGLTDVFGPTPPSHWEILRRALAAEHVIVYAGHSGIGENFRLARIEKQLSLAHETLAAECAQAPAQLIAFLSCYSYMYFGRDLEKERIGASRKEFLYTGTGFTKGDRGTLAVLDLVDQALAPRAKDGAPLQLRYVVPEDFLILKGKR